MATELTKEEKKALRKEKFKKILKIVGIAAGSAAVAGVAGVAAYAYGKKEGYKNGEEVGIAETKIKNGIDMYDVLDDYHSKLFAYAESGDFVSKYENSQTGEVKYMTYNVSDEAPECWDECVKFDLKEEVVNELNQ